MPRTLPRQVRQGRAAFGFAIAVLVVGSLAAHSGADGPLGEPVVSFLGFAIAALCGGIGFRSWCGKGAVGLLLLALGLLLEMADAAIPGRAATLGGALGSALGVLTGLTLASFVPDEGPRLR